eukprot:GHVH01010937.1.p2 GENE.GHVH01010937.1~~GHVH01010937.1.p2  ORF type:complete len:106 (+),score=12.85 GHVH01010937.1:214-531(+)
MLAEVPNKFCQEDVDDSEDIQSLEIDNGVNGSKQSHPCRSNSSEELSRPKTAPCGGDENPQSNSDSTPPVPRPTSSYRNAKYYGIPCTICPSWCIEAPVSPFKAA